MTTNEATGLLREARHQVEQALRSQHADSAHLNAEIAMAKALIAVAERLIWITERMADEDDRRDFARQLADNRANRRAYPFGAPSDE